MPPMTRRSLLLYSICFFFCLSAKSQVTITNSTFPGEGDTLFTVFDNEIENLNLAAAGEDQTWDFSGLGAAFAQELIFRNASEGSFSAQFPSAELYTAGVNGDEVYYRSNSATMIELGRTADNPISDSLQVLIDFTEPSLYRRAPFTYGDTFESDSESTITIPGDELPDSLLASFPVAPDSIRLTINEMQFDTMDAWGTLILPSGEFDVVRERRHTITQISLSVYIVIGWITVDPEQLGELGAFFEETSNYSYNFYSPELKEIAARVTLDQDQNPQNVEYASEQTISSVPVIAPKQQDVIAYPNPSYGHVKFQFVNLPKTNYKIVVKDLLGKEVNSKTIDLRKSSVQAMDLGNLPKGTYLFSVFDPSGHKLLTKRLLILNP